MWWMTEERTGLNPFNGIGRLQSEINRLFEGSGFNAFPAVNIWSDAEKIELRAEIPGVEPKDLKISILGDQLSVEAEVKAEGAPKEAVWHRQERPCGKFSRSFALPYAVDAEKTVAKFKNGVLSVTMARQEASKPKRIELS